VEIVLERSDGYREDQVAIAANRFPKKLRAGFVFSPNGTASAVARYSLRGLSRAGTSFPNPLCFSVPASMRQHGDSIPNHIILGKAFLRIRIPPMNSLSGYEIRDRLSVVSMHSSLLCGFSTHFNLISRNPVFE
jgi:hypothetical protein